MNNNNANFFDSIQYHYHDFIGMQIEILSKYANYKYEKWPQVKLMKSKSKQSRPVLVFSRVKS